MDEIGCAGRGFKTVKGYVTLFADECATSSAFKMRDGVGQRTVAGTASVFRGGQEEDLMFPFFNANID